MAVEIHVAVGVIYGDDGRILIARRASSAHQGGLWEFPGGKVDAGETVQQALTRELQEELAIQVTRCEPLITIRHDYGDKVVFLDVHRVLAFTGEPCGNEGQPIEWVVPADLPQYEFPKANRAIISALLLPDRMLITGDAASLEELVSRTERALEHGVRWVQLRLPEQRAIVLVDAAQALREICKRYGAVLSINSSPALFSKTDSDALHLNRHQLMSLSSRPVDQSVWLGASCHNREEVLKAKDIGVDYVLISPVLPTLSHPEQPTLGWTAFQQLAQLSGVPAFALGGMDENHIAVAKEHGGQGIAAIRCWWNADQN